MSCLDSPTKNVRTGMMDNDTCRKTVPAIQHITVAVLLVIETSKFILNKNINATSK